MRVSKAFCTTASFSASSADVASSRKSNRGLRKKQRAIANRWRCPPESSMPRSPTRVSYCSSASMIKSWAFAALHAATTSSCAYDRPSPYARFSSMDLAKSCVSCATNPQHMRTLRDDSCLMSFPSRRIRPPVGS
mmetsp:Transcript_100203/g.198745  ORF Transcript_100203/g.198745 Transcript_100203/m.198745 type:complete len:135 (+) Transcript_100203:698-1102(+)